MLFTSECRRVRDVLWDVASGAAATSESERAHKHIARCDACRGELESYRNTISLIAEYKGDAVPSSRLGWRDVQARVAEQSASPGIWAKRPVIQFVMGGGSLALATAFVMFVMQANTNPPKVGTQTTGRQSSVGLSHGDVVSTVEPESTNFRESAGMLGVAEMPPVDVATAPALKSAPPSVYHGAAVRFKQPVRDRKGAESTPQLVANTSDVNVDGGGPIQALHPEYVLASASSGNDEEQNRRYVIDVVSTSASSNSTDGSEESHPW